MEINNLIDSVADIINKSVDTLEHANNRMSKVDVSLYLSVVKSVNETLKLIPIVLEKASNDFEFYKEHFEEEKNLKNELYAYLCETSGMSDFQVWLKEYRTRDN